jgi:hypothetical protein
MIENLLVGDDVVYIFSADMVDDDRLKLILNKSNSLYGKTGTVLEIRKDNCLTVQFKNSDVPELKNSDGKILVHRMALKKV